MAKKVSANVRRSVLKGVIATALEKHSNAPDLPSRLTDAVNEALIELEEDATSSPASSGTSD